MNMTLFTTSARPWAASLALGACMIFGLATTSHAQILSRGDLFGPGAPPPLIGLEVGLGKHQQQGTFDANCGCTFDQGTGTGLLGNIVFDLPLDYEWAIGLKVGVDFKNTTGTTTLVDQAIIQITDAERDTLAGILLNRNATVKTTYFSVAPFAQYQFFRMGPFLQAGPSISFLIANHFEHQRELISNTAKLADGTEITNLRFTNGTREEVVQDSSIDHAAGIRLGLLLSAGYHVSVSERSVLTPMLTYDFPISTIRQDQANGWKIGSLYGSVALKFRLE